MPETLTLTIGGHTFTLVSGRSYIASRPMMDGRKQTHFPVSITDITEPGLDGPVIATVEGLTYDQANELLAAFNKGPSSFEGRVWDYGLTASNSPALAKLEADRAADEARFAHGLKEEDYREEGDFSDEDFEAADRAWANIAAREKAIAAGEIDPDDDDEDFYKEGDFGDGKPDPDLDRFYGSGF